MKANTHHPNHRAESIIFATLSFFVGVVVFFLNKIAHTFFLFWTLDRFDSFLHLIGGISVGIFFTVIADIYITSWSNLTPKKQSHKFLMVAILSSLIVGLIWEFYEYTAGLTNYSHKFFKLTMLDSSSDILMDLIGGIFGFLVYWINTYKYRK